MYENWIKNFLIDTPQNAYGLYDGNKLISVCLIEDSFYQKDFAFVSLIFNLQENSSKGNAEKLLKKIIYHLAEKDYSRLYSNFVASNFPSQKLFNKLGFVTYNSLLELRKIYD